MNLNAVGNTTFSSIIQQLTEELKSKENSDSIWTTNQSPIGTTGITANNTLLPNNIASENQILPLILLMFQSLLGQESDEQNVNNVASNGNSNINLSDLLTMFTGNATQTDAIAAQTVSPKATGQIVNNTSNEINNSKKSIRDNGMYLMLGNTLNIPQGDNLEVSEDGNTTIVTKYRNKDKTDKNGKIVYTTTTDENGNERTTVTHIGKTGGYKIDPDNSKVSSISEYVNDKIIKQTSYLGTSEYKYNDDGSVTKDSYDTNGVIKLSRTERPIDEDGLSAYTSDKYEDGKLIREHEVIGSGSMVKGEDRLRMGVIENHEKDTTYVYKDQTEGATRTRQSETYDVNGNLRKFTDLETEYKDKNSYLVKSFKMKTSEFTENGELDAFEIEENISGGKIKIEYKDGEMTKTELELVDGKYVVKSQEEVSEAEQTKLKAEMSKIPEDSLKDELKEKSELLSENEEKLATVEEAKEEAASAVEEAKEEAKEEAATAQEAAKDDGGSEADSINDKISKNVSAITED